MVPVEADDADFRRVSCQLWYLSVLLGGRVVDAKGSPVGYAGDNEESVTRSVKHDQAPSYSQELLIGSVDTSVGADDLTSEVRNRVAVAEREEEDDRDLGLSMMVVGQEVGAGGATTP